MNGVFSIVGVGAAAWWISKSTGWKDEWVRSSLRRSHIISYNVLAPLQRLLLALAAAIVVAVAEGGIYYIHTSRRDAAAAYRKKERELEAEQLRLKIEKETLQDTKPEETLLLEKSGTGDAEVSRTVETLRQRSYRERRRARASDKPTRLARLASLEATRLQG